MSPPLKPKLVEQDYVRAAVLLGCEAAAIQAVAEVEAPYGGFLPTGELTILFERHWFSKLTRHRFDKIDSNISNPKPGGYEGGIGEHTRLQIAVAMDRVAALKSTSWGKFQIMGFNHAACGMSTIQQFVNLMYTSEVAQLGLFCNFMQTLGYNRLLRTGKFSLFASKYNGPDYKTHDYDTRLWAAYKSYGGVLT